MIDLVHEVEINFWQQSRWCNLYFTMFVVAFLSNICEFEMMLIIIVNESARSWTIRLQIIGVFLMIFI